MNEEHLRSPIGQMLMSQALPESGLMYAPEECKSYHSPQNSIAVLTIRKLILILFPPLRKDKISLVCQYDHKEVCIFIKISYISILFLCLFVYFFEHILVGGII